LTEHHEVDKRMNPGILFPDIHLASFRDGSRTKLTMKV